MWHRLFYLVPPTLHYRPAGLSFHAGLSTLVTSVALNFEHFSSTPFTLRSVLKRLAIVKCTQG